MGTRTYGERLLTSKQETGCINDELQSICRPIPAITDANRGKVLESQSATKAIYGATYASLLAAK